MDVHNLVPNCMVCAGRNTHVLPKTKGALQRYTSFEIIAMNVFEPVIYHGHKHHVLSTINHFTRFVVLLDYSSHIIKNKSNGLC